MPPRTRTLKPITTVVTTTCNRCKQSTPVADKFCIECGWEVGTLYIVPVETQEESMTEPAVETVDTPSNEHYFDDGLRETNTPTFRCSLCGIIQTDTGQFSCKGCGATLTENAEDGPEFAHKWSPGEGSNADGSSPASPSAFPAKTYPPVTTQVIRNVTFEPTLNKASLGYKKGLNLTVTLELGGPDTARVVAALGGMMGQQVTVVFTGLAEQLRLPGLADDEDYEEEEG